MISFDDVLNDYASQIKSLSKLLKKLENGFNVIKEFQNERFITFIHYTFNLIDIKELNKKEVHLLINNVVSEIKKYKKYHSYFSRYIKNRNRFIDIIDNKFEPHHRIIIRNEFISKNSQCELILSNLSLFKKVINREVQPTISKLLMLLRILEFKKREFNGEGKIFGWENGNVYFINGYVDDKK